MTRQEQIEEMCEAIASMICQIYNPQCDEYEPHTCSHCYANGTLIGDFAEMLYNAGYRKTPDDIRELIDVLAEGANLKEKLDEIERLKAENEKVYTVRNDLLKENDELIKTNAELLLLPKQAVKQAKIDVLNELRNRLVVYYPSVISVIDELIKEYEE